MYASFRLAIPSDLSVFTVNAIYSIDLLPIEIQLVESHELQQVIAQSKRTLLELNNA